MRKYVILLMGISALLGCQSSIYSLTQRSLYSPGEFRYAAADKRLHTVLWGNPSNQPDAVFTHRVLTLMQQVNASFEVALVRPTTFASEGGDRPEYQVVVVFNPRHDTTAQALCTATIAAPVLRSDNRIEARMVFCRQAQVLSTSYAVIDALNGSDDPRFEWMIHSLTRELFPQRESRHAARHGLLLFND